MQSYLTTIHLKLDLLVSDFPIKCPLGPQHMTTCVLLTSITWSIFKIYLKTATMAEYYPSFSLWAILCDDVVMLLCLWTSGTRPGSPLKFKFNLCHCRCLIWSSPLWPYESHYMCHMSFTPPWEREDGSTLTYSRSWGSHLCTTLPSYGEMESVARQRLNYKARFELLFATKI